MPEGTGIGVYPFGEVADARENDEVSSTYEGRHLTVKASEISSHDPAHALQQKGHPLVVGENIVGVAFQTEVLGTDLISFDTEGIWLLSVVALNPVAVAIIAGDELFINKTTAIISNNPNPATHTVFGYALGGVTAGQTAIISVKVHWMLPSDAMERVATAVAPYTSDVASIKFREYYYEAIGGGLITADSLSLVISTVRAGVVQTLKRVLTLPGDADRVGGYSAVGEFELNVLGVGNAIQHTMTAVKLAFHNESTLSINNYQCAFIQLADYSAIATAMMPRLLHFISEPATLRDAGVDNDRILTDCQTDHPMNASIRIGYGPNATPLYIMCTTNAPD